ncbi:hypothetical protein F503_03593 [Ophiostoma piceae UAMH 11346]|uniref:Uncharacterized protein n=1 Tax=Ophiostoma piceae (strain UAMH 11346) TaxID=1262450 RepID=S3BYG9_OPHP1|nr:hypothetical protein F503_03593 [Ophiostoma piceae UAMH 11346]
MTINWTAEGTPLSGPAASAHTSTSTTADYPHIVHSSSHNSTHSSTHNSTLEVAHEVSHEDANEDAHEAPSPPLLPVHIFKLAYAMALAGRFIFELEHFLDTVRRDTGVPVSVRPPTDTAAYDTYRDTCVLAQGFYQVSTKELPLHQRIDRIWLACRTFFFRGMITTVDGHGIPSDPSAPPEPVHDESGLQSTFSAADIPSLLAARCNIHLPSVASDSEYFLWASAGCVLGKHCVNVTELPFKTMGVADMTDAVAQMEARLQRQDRLSAASSSSSSSSPSASSAPRKRVWCPVMMHGPPDKIIVELCRRLELKEQQYRVLLHKFCHFEEEERRMEADAASDA